MSDLEDARKLIEGVRGRNTDRDRAHLVGRATDELVLRRPRLFRCIDREECEQEGWVFLLGAKGQEALRRAESAQYPDRYVLAAVYRHLLRWASRECGAGQYRKRPKMILVDDDFWDRQPAPEATTQSDLPLLLDDAPPPVRQYLEGKSEGLTDGEMRQKWGWTRTDFATVQEQVHSWLCRQYPDAV